MQDVHTRPDPNPQRQAALTRGRVTDHAGHVTVRPLPDFDLNRTIFQTLEGAIPRAVMAARIGKDIQWDPTAAARIGKAYQTQLDGQPVPTPDARLLAFMADYCNFDVEHADGSFLDHLWFGYEYTLRHYPDHSPIVMFLHSILGTGTNTFAMPAEHIPALRALLTPFEWTHIEAFPSVLRLLYDGRLREELRDRANHLDAIRGLRMHRVIDNAPIELSADDLWIQLNYQLIHLVDFLPVANWSAWQTESSFIVFRDLLDLLRVTGKLHANVAWDGPRGPRFLLGERTTLAGWLSTRLPVGVAESMSVRSIRAYSAAIGHDLEYELVLRG